MTSASDIKIVRMRGNQLDLMRSILALTPQQIDSMTRLMKSGSLGRLGDYENWQQEQIVPAEGFIKPYGPANPPIVTKDAPSSVLDGLNKIYNELVRHRTPQRPLIRAKAITAGGNVTLDWSMNGLMSRIMMRNEGPNSVWFSFDQDGASVSANTSNNSIEMQSQESWNIELCEFSKIGLKCAGGGTATVHAIAFPSLGSGAVG